MPIDEEALYQLLGTRVRAARTRIGLSQEKLATRLGMSRTSIVNIEAGRQRPPLHVLWAIADNVNTELALLLPSRTDYNEQVAPVELDTATISQIEAAANGDPKTRRDLITFISRARSSET